MKKILACSLLLVLAGCGKSPELPADVTASTGSPDPGAILPDKTGPIAKTKEECAALKGLWFEAKEPVPAGCLVPTSDAGKKCRDSSECESICEAPEDAQDGQATTGTCFSRFNTLGTCLRRVTDGKVGDRICRD